MREHEYHMCANCVHFQKPQSEHLILDHIKGECHRYPPLVVAISRDEETHLTISEAIWPRVDDNDYCGEFE